MPRATRSCSRCRAARPAAASRRIRWRASSGDEFAIILLSEREPDRIIAFADMVRRAVTTPITYAEREIFLTASIGLALHDPQIAARREEVLRNAEIAMVARQAPRRRPHRGVPARPCARTAATTSTMENDLRQALDRNEIKVLFKPIVRLEDRTIAGFESMLRWDHPRLGRVGPEDFMSIAEETGLIVNLGFFLLEQTARELAAWQDALEVEPPIFASVNMSSHHLLRHDLLQDVKSRDCAHGRAAGFAQARDDREPRDGESRIFGPDAEPPARSRRGPVAGRFRHRLFGALLPAALPVRHDQDRQILRAPDGRQQADHPALHHQDGA